MVEAYGWLWTGGKSTIGKVGKGKTPFHPDALVVRYEVNGEKDWTRLPEGVLRLILERNEAVCP